MAVCRRAGLWLVVVLLAACGGDCESELPRFARPPMDASMRDAGDAGAARDRDSGEASDAGDGGRDSSSE